MKGKSRDPSRKRESLISPGKRKDYPQAKPNRLKKQERKLIQMNPRYHFFMSEDGCVYYLKEESNE